MQDLERRFAAHWKELVTKSQSGKVLLTLSGGIDSMTLAHLLRSAGISFAAAHCNFGLRGADSDADEAFVRAWCANHEVTCHVTDLDVTLAEGSTQMAARSLRYEWFEQLLREHHYTAILTAHHASDVAETMLINLARGTGLAGLHGIPRSRGKILRPLLFAMPEDIAGYAKQTGIQWQEDATNATDAYLRNAIRRQIIPVLETLMPGAVRRMAETAARIESAETLYRSSIDARLRKMVSQRGADWYLPIRLWKKESLAPTLAYEWFTQYSFTAGQVTDLLGLLNSESGRGVSSDTHRVIRHRDFLVMTALEQKVADLIAVAEIPTTIETSQGLFTFSWAELPVEIITDANTALLDAHDISLPLFLRTRRDGDYFYPLGMGGKKKKLKKFLIDQKVGLHEKERIHILECGKKILWVAGQRIDERFKVQPSTTKMLKVVFKPV